MPDGKVIGEKSLFDYIIELQGIKDDLARVIRDLEGKTTLESEKTQLEKAQEYVTAALKSFKRLKGIR